MNIAKPESKRTVFTPEQEAYICLLFCCCGDFYTTTEFKFYGLDDHKFHLALGFLGDEVVNKADKELAKLFWAPMKTGTTLEEKLIDFAGRIPEDRRRRVYDQVSVLCDNSGHEQDERVKYIVGRQFGFELGQYPVDNGPAFPDLL